MSTASQLTAALGGQRCVVVCVRFGARIVVARIAGLALVRHDSLVLTTLACRGCSLHIDRRHLQQEKQLFSFTVFLSNHLSLSISLAMH